LHSRKVSASFDLQNGGGMHQSSKLQKVSERRQKTLKSESEETVNHTRQSLQHDASTKS
jgi:hypothetical protein